MLIAFIRRLRRFSQIAHDLRAWKIAELSGVSRPTINQLFMKLRIRIAQVCNAIHSDGWRGYNGLVDMGYKKNFRVHHRVHHGEHEFARGNCHINGIESFWSYAKLHVRASKQYISDVDLVSRWVHEYLQTE